MRRLRTRLAELGGTSARPQIDYERILAPFESTSVFDLFELLPDEESCLRFLFELRGGPQLRCPKCRSSKGWRQAGADPFFRSNCCGEAVDVRRGTLFGEVRLDVRIWLYLLATFLNRPTPLSTEFIADHLDTSRDKAWRALAQIRRHIHRVNVRHFDPCDYARCYVDEFLYRPIRDSTGGSRSRIWLVGLCGNSNVHVEPIEARIPGLYR